MKQTAIAAILLAVTSVPGLGAGYGFLNAGIDYLNRDRFADAVEWLGKALASGDLIPDQTRIALANRGRAYVRLNEPGKAVSDFSAALAIAPDDTGTLLNRAFAYVDLEQPDKALADMTALQRKRPNDSTIAFERGMVEWQLKDYPEASAAFLSAYSSGITYAWLWLQLSNIKDGKSVENYVHRLIFIPQLNMRLRSGAWPDPIASFYAGEKSEEDVFQAAGESQGSTCEANFYLAEWRMVHGDKAGAKPMMEKAIQDCPADFVEARMARLAMKELP